MWREKMIKISWWILALNLLVCLSNMGFGYQHVVKHEPWLAGFSFFLVVFNGWVAWLQWRNIVRFKQELKDLMWTTLTKPSEQII